MNTATSDNNVNYDFNFGNFNPDNVEVEDTINAVFAIDVSSSVGGYVDELNKGMNEFTQRMQKSHVAEKLFVSIVEFQTDVKVKSGFQPIGQIPNIDFSNSIGGMTALFEGTRVALKNALDYRESLENAGVNCKTLLFVITDGDNNCPGKASDVKDMITNLLKEERNVNSFEAILFGIGKGSGMEQYFTQAASDMGIKNVATIDNSASDIKKMINFISSSVSSASGNGSAISTPNF
ncbi:MAG: VWA domain-containing protein [Nanoarchaeota archaeon]